MKGHSKILSVQLVLLAVLFLWASATPAVAQPSRGIRVKGRDALPEQPQRRIALVIGNKDYKIVPLKNPINDSQAMAATLSQLGFQVTALKNAKRREMALAIREFGNSLRKGGVGLFYYSGHGVEVNGRNYMIPIGAQVAHEDEVEFESVDAGRVLRAMERAGNGMNIVILDACRNNPFARTFSSASQGLARMDAPQGTFISYATSPGKVASDGSGSYGLYTGQLVKHMKTRGITVEEMFKRVRGEVFEKSGKTQVPWTSSTLIGQFYFGNPPSSGARQPVVAANIPPPSAPVRAVSGAEEEFWYAVRDSEHTEDIQAYLTAYPKGKFVQVANLRMQQLQRMSRIPDGPRIIGAPVGVPGQPRPDPTISRLVHMMRGHRSYVQTVAFSPDGSKIVSGSRDRTLRVWDTASGNLVTTLKKEKVTYYGARFTADGKLVISGDSDGRMRLWDVARGMQLRVVKGHRDDIYGVDYFPRSGLALSGSDDEDVMIWDVGARRLLRTLEGHDDDVRAVAFSADGTRALSGADDKTMILWDVNSGQLLRKYKGHRRSVLSVAFSPLGTLAISGSSDKSVKIWDLSTGQVVQHLRGFRGIPYAVAFTRDGRFAMAGVQDRTVRIWDVSTWQMVETLKAHRKHVFALAVSPDGRHFATGSADRTVKLWELPRR